MGNCVNKKRVFNPGAVLDRSNTYQIYFSFNVFDLVMGEGGEIRCTGGGVRADGRGGEGGEVKELR